MPLLYWNNTYLEWRISSMKSTLIVGCGTGPHVPDRYDLLPSDVDKRLTYKAFSRMFYVHGCSWGTWERLTEDPWTPVWPQTWGPPASASWLQLFKHTAQHLPGEPQKTGNSPAQRGPKQLKRAFVWPVWLHVCVCAFVCACVCLLSFSKEDLTKNYYWLERGIFEHFFLKILTLEVFYISKNISRKKPLLRKTSI